MLRDGIGFRRTIVCCGRVDLRREIDGLSTYVRLNYGLDTLEKGTLFLFCGRRADRIKGLCFEGDGTCLHYKRLAPGEPFPMAPHPGRSQGDYTGAVQTPHGRLYYRRHYTGSLSETSAGDPALS